MMKNLSLNILGTIVYRKEKNMKIISQAVETLLSGIGASQTQNQEMALENLPEKESKPLTQPTKPSPSLESPLSDDVAGKQALAAFLVDCFNALDTFGKTPDQVKASVKMHLLTLGKYPLSKVKAAYLQWIERNSKMPAPSDIVNIITPPQVEWKPDTALFISLMQKVHREGYYLWGEEKRFIEKCRRYWLDNAFAPESDNELLAYQAATGLITFHETEH